MSAPLQIVIIGAGGFGREVRNLLDSFLPDQPFRFKGYLAQDAGVPSQQSDLDEILAEPEAYQPEEQDRFILAIGNMEARQRIVDVLLSKHAQFLTAVHPLAFVSPSARLGQGVLIYPFAAVSNNAVLDDFVKLNYYASVGHDTQLGRCCLLAPYATVNGFGVLEDYVYLSTRATVAPQVTLGANSIISANSAAMNSVPPSSLVFGVPGRVTRRL